MKTNKITSSEAWNMANAKKGHTFLSFKASNQLTASAKMHGRTITTERVYVNHDLRTDEPKVLKAVMVTLTNKPIKDK